MNRWEAAVQFDCVVRVKATKQKIKTKTFMALATPTLENLADPTTPQPLRSPETMRARTIILLADDDPGVREMVGRVLESERFQVMTSSTGAETARQFEAGGPDLVLLDLNMPGGDGWSVLRFINFMQPMLPVIIMTARPDQYAQAEDLGVDALMEKPLNLAVLLSEIKTLLAETVEQRAHRLARPDFKTTLLPGRAAQD